MESRFMRLFYFPCFGKKFVRKILGIAPTISVDIECISSVAYGLVAQSVQQRIKNPCAGGSPLLEFGLSRITASAVAALIPDSSLTSDQVKASIRDQPEALLQLSSLIIAGLREQGLLVVAMDDQ
jgi:hypothetical protein